MASVTNPTVSLNKPFDYEAEQDAILRRQKYADILNQEAMQPLKPGSYQGIEAPISPLSGLAKILEGAGAGYLESQAAEGKREFGQQARAAGDEFMRNLEIPPMQGAGEGDPGGFQKPQLHPTEAKRERLAKTLRGLSDPNPYVNIPAKAEYAELIRDRKIKSPYAPIVAKEYTPESIELFNRSINSDGKGGDYSLLVPVPPPGEKDHADVAGYKFYSQQTREAGGTPMSFKDYIYAKASAGATRVKVGGGLTAYEDIVGKKTGERHVEGHLSVQKASDGIVKIDEVLDNLLNSTAYTGFAAELKTNIKRVQVMVSQNAKAGKHVSDTELLDVMLGSDVFPMIQSLGIGARGMDTPAEREFLRKVMAGTIDLNKETLIKMAEMRRRVSVNIIERWNQSVDSGELDHFFKVSKIPKSRFPMPGEMPKYRPPASKIDTPVGPNSFGALPQNVQDAVDRANGLPK